MAFINSISKRFSQIDPDLKYVFFWILIWKLIVVGIILIASYHSIPAGAEPPSVEFSPPGFYGYFSKWDGSIYIKISKLGYLSDHTLAAFFPAFPLAIRYFALITGLNNWLAGLIINFFATIVAGYYLIKLAKLHVDTETAKNAFFYFIFFPAAAFLNFIYTEALFLAFIIPSFYYMRKQKFLTASLLGMGAALTRNLGVFMVIPLFIEVIMQYVNQKNLKLFLVNSFKLLFVPLGLGLYMYYLYQVFNDPLHFVTAQKVWEREINFNLLGTFYNYAKEMLATHNYWLAMEIGHSILFFIFSFYALYRLRFSYGVFMLICLIIPLLSGKFGAINRYCLVLFPAFLIMAIWGKKSEYIGRTIMMAELLLFGVYITLFVHNYWVA